VAANSVDEYEHGEACELHRRPDAEDAEAVIGEVKYCSAPSGSCANGLRVSATRKAGHHTNGDGTAVVLCLRSLALRDHLLAAATVG
jgi:hypothetical protein